jgi:hypothetical protein
MRGVTPKVNRGCWPDIDSRGQAQVIPLSGQKRWGTGPRLLALCPGGEPEGNFLSESAHVLPDLAFELEAQQIGATCQHECKSGFRGRQPRIPSVGMLSHRIVWLRRRESSRTWPHANELVTPPRYVRLDLAHLTNHLAAYIERIVAPAMGAARPAASAVDARTVPTVLAPPALRHLP